MSSSELRPLVDSLEVDAFFPHYSSHRLTEGRKKVLFMELVEAVARNPILFFIPSSTHVSQVACKLLLPFFSC